MPSTSTNDLAVRKQERIDIWLIIPLLFAAACLTVGLAMYLSGTEQPADVVQPVIVVFGGTLAVLLVTFPMPQLNQALQASVTRGLRGGTAPSEMIRAMMKVCDISRREGLIGVADIRSNSEEVEEVCHLIGDAATEPRIQFSLERRLNAERMFHQMIADVFLFTAMYAVLMGLLGSLIRLSTTEDPSLSFAALPFVIGVSLAILMGILVGRLRSVHIREMVVVDIAYQSAAIVLDDNNVQRLRNRLAAMVPTGLRA
ncbi:MAG: hypothetical protein KTR32_11245 [Granulosicoccus sp.]|nr:hypothetical protein [Granulosicoccus sp.]